MAVAPPSSLRLLLPLSLLLFSTGVFAVTIQCPGTKSGCKCQATENVTCPAGYYCPGYSAETILDLGTLITEANCTVRSDGELQCPCSPGFYCPANTLSPSYCCAGHYCPMPSEINECKEGYFCKTGYVEGLPCGSKRDCPAGSEYSSRTGALAAILGVVGALYIVFLVKYFLETKVREAKDSLLLEMKENKHVVVEEISPAGVERLSVAHDALKSTSPPSNESKKSSFSMGKDSELAAKPSASEIDYLIEFEDISLVLPSGVQIMKGVCGKFQPRRLCAIMGPSGAGKTTIINLVTGKAVKTDGTIKVNGEVVNDLSKWKKLVGFVPQEDVMIRQLTVRDNIEFSANYRLPIEMSKPERTAVVNETLIDLGIEHVQFSVIGDERERGVSGGQRKRVNIGIELVALPKVLFLDEPTSGLDSTSSAVLARQLKDIAMRRGVTIASVIHQPSIQAFLEFDDLLLLGKGGQVVYHGPIAEAGAYFASIGFTPTGLINPADFYLDITNGAVARDGDPDFVPAHLFRFWENTRQGKPYNYVEVSDIEENSKSLMKESLVLNDSQNPRAGRMTSIAAYSPAHALRLNDELNPSTLDAALVFLSSFFGFFFNMARDFVIGIFEVFETFIREVTRNDEIRNTPGFLGQIFYCFKRAFKQKYRRYGAFLSQMLIHLGVALVVSSVSTDLQFVGPLPDVICATVTRDLYDQCTSPLSDSYQGNANFLCFGTIFAAISISAGTFGNEQVNYWRESTAGLKTTPYFLAKWIIEVPNIILAALFFWLAFTARFPNTNSPGELYELFLAMYWWVWSLGFLLSAISPPKNVFLVGVLVALLLAVGFSGANPTINEIQDLPKGINWLWRVSGTRWALEAFYVSQVKYYEKVPSGPLKNEPYMDVDAGLDKIGYNIDYFEYAVRALFWNGFGYAILAMVIMRFTNRDKKK